MKRSTLDAIEIAYRKSVLVIPYVKNSRVLIIENTLRVREFAVARKDDAVNATSTPLFCRHEINHN